MNWDQVEVERSRLAIFFRCGLGCAESRKEVGRAAR